MMKNNLIPVNSSSFVSFFVDLNIAKKVGLPPKDFLYMEMIGNIL